MGTRHLTCVINNGTHKIAQYGQWDGYPSGAGLSILNFLSEEKNIENLRINSSKCSFVSDKEYQKIKESFEDRGVLYDEFFKEYPQFSRDTGDDILSIVASSDGDIKLVDSYDFAADSLFCEWAYVIDLDNDMFEVYEGFNKQPLNKEERFYNIQNLKDATLIYYPVKLVAEFSFKNLPDKDEFLKKCGDV